MAGYDYQTERPWVFTDEGQRALLKYRDAAFALLKEAGAFRDHALHRKANVSVGDNWKQLALIDRLVELDDLRCVASNCARQYFIYVSGKEP